MPCIPTIAITVGDVAGIGLEIILKALSAQSEAVSARYVIMVPSEFIAQRMKDIGVELHLHCGESLAEYAHVEPGVYIHSTYVIDDTAISLGKPNAASAYAAQASLDTAIQAAREGFVDAIVTAPLSKENMRAHNSPAVAHTEYLAEQFKVARFAMMFAADHMRVTLATRHIALKAVPETLNRELLLDTIGLTHEALITEGVARPRIAVCALNPHAGEGGLMGDEEAHMLIPVIEEVRTRLGDIRGPVPADTAFYQAYQRQVDAVIALYHDQGLGPFKMLYFDKGVNVTLGLPIVRTSPDHGTAFGIAARFCANWRSMEAALAMAVNLSIMRAAQHLQ